jgi:phage shock protein E
MTGYWLAFNLYYQLQPTPASPGVVVSGWQIMLRDCYAARPFQIRINSGLSFMSTNLFSGIWIDVRTTDEFNAGHITGAAHIPYEEIAARISEVTSDKDATIHLYCRSGNRSGIAHQTLQAMGFKNAVNEGGYEALLQQ